MSESMTAAVHSGLVEEVAGILADRVPAGVLDRVLVELLAADSGGEYDDDLRELLERGTVSRRLHRLHVGGAYLVAVRSPQQRRLLPRLRMHADAYRVQLAVCSLGGPLWLLAPSTSRATLEQMLRQCSVPGMLAAGDDLVDLRLAPSRRVSLEELLAVGERRGWRGLVETSRLSAARRVEALLDLAARQPELLEGPLDVLLEDPAHVQLAETLYQWFACGRDTVATAAATHLHVNSVRYRLKRAQEISGLDLGDWDERLVAEVQLRMWRATGAASEPVRETSRH